MASVIEIRAPNEADRKTVKEFFYAMPLVERGKPAFAELLWVLLGRQDEANHAMILPDYCYHIFDALRATFFAGFPSLTDTVCIRDPQGLSEATTLEDTKSVVQMDWKKLGRMLGICARCMRFAELESQNGVDGEGFDDSSPEKRKELFTVIFGKQWVEGNADRIATEHPDKILSDMLNEFMAPLVKRIVPAARICSAFAWQWGTIAAIEFQEGIAEGMTIFLDENGFLVGERNRSSTYVFLLLAWREISDMAAANPRKTVTDLHEWMLPFMRVGVTTYLDLDHLRDVCAPVSQKGIGLSLRPFKSSQDI